MSTSIKVYTRNEVESISSDMTRILQKNYPNMDTTQLAAMMLYAGSYLVYMNSPARELTVSASIAFHLLLNPNNDEVSKPEQESSVRTDDPKPSKIITEW